MAETMRSSRHYPKYTPARVEAVLDALRAGNTRTAAARAVGIHDTTIAAWMERHPEFSAAVEKAEAEAEQRMVSRVKLAADEGTWTAAAWWLERRRHQDWAKREYTELSSSDEKPFRFTIVIDRRGSEDDAASS